jgi:hypothetical protein
MESQGGENYAVWNDTYKHGNWALASPLVADETAFLDGDSVVFDGVADAGRENMRNIYVGPKVVYVADMTLTGSGAYRITGGSIETNIGDNNLRGPDASGTKMIDLSTGQLLLDENFTGLLILDNSSNKFTGKVLEDGSVSDGIVVQGGTLQARASLISGNRITNNSVLAFDQPSEKETFKGTINGMGNIIKTGEGALGLDGSASLLVRNMEVREGTFIVSSTMNVAVADTLSITPTGTLALPGYELIAANVVNLGALMRWDASSGSGNKVNILDSVDPLKRVTKIYGNYHSEDGAIVVCAYPNMVYADTIWVYGNSSGDGKIQIQVSNTTAGGMDQPAAKRDTLVFSTLGSGRDIRLTMDWEHSVLEDATSGEVFDSADNYVLLQGKDRNWYLRNLTVMPAREQLPFMAASPAIADMMQKAQVRSLYLHTNARHDDLRENGMIWTNYMHNEDRLRDDFYEGTMLKADIFQVGVDYAILPKRDRSRFQLSGGISYAFGSGRATRKDLSTIDIDAQYINGYVTARYGISYLHVIGSFSPDMRYRVRTTYGLDSDGEVDGSSASVSAELGLITTPLGGGQLEPYIQIIGQKHNFGTISTPSEYYEYDDLSSANLRDYSFKNPTTLRGMAGLRWGSHLQLKDNPDWAFRPWGGVAYGRNMSNDYLISAGGHVVRYDNRGNFYTFTGGLSALWRKHLQVYLTLEWSGGRPMNNYTLNTGINYLW